MAQSHLKIFQVLHSSAAPVYLINVKLNMFIVPKTFAHQRGRKISTIFLPGWNISSWWLFGFCRRDSGRSRDQGRTCSTRWHLRYRNRSNSSQPRWHFDLDFHYIFRKIKGYLILIFTNVTFCLRYCVIPNVKCRFVCHSDDSTYYHCRSQQQE
jgi:hypothetical protein